MEESNINEQVLRRKPMCAMCFKPISEMEERYSEAWFSEPLCYACQNGEDPGSFDQKVLKI